MEKAKIPCIVTPTHYKQFKRQSEVQVLLIAHCGCQIVVLFTQYF